jgi:outer membrane biosynthesis protein TonB
LLIGGKVLGAKVVFKVDPEYPELARRVRVSGRVVLEVLVNEEGVPSGQFANGATRRLCSTESLYPCMALSSSCSDCDESWV